MSVARLVQLVERRLGLRGDDLAERCARLLDDAAEPARLVERFAAGDRASMSAVAAELTVGETYFYRHAEQFHAFVEAAVPQLLGARGRLAVLSAGCSSGEEPYTLAMLLRDLAPATVMGIDVNPRAVERARRGRYTSWSLRAIPAELRARWFTEVGNEWELASSLRSAVAFEERNLVDDGELWTPGRWDAIFCRNVTMYFTEGRAREVIQRFTRALVPGGFLFLGHAESLRGHDELGLCHTHGTFYYRRATAAVAVNPPANWVDEIRAASERVQSLTDAARPAVAPIVERRAAVLDAVRAMIAEERYAEALARLAEAPLEAGDPEALLLRAVLQTQRGALGEARATCQALLAQDPQHAGCHYLLALSNETIGDLAAARAHARRAVELDPTFAMARLHLGLIARRQADPDAARSELREALARLPHEPDERLALFGGGFQRQALVELCRSELAAVTR